MTDVELRERITDLCTDGSEVDYTLSVSVEDGCLVLKQANQFPKLWRWSTQASAQLAAAIIEQQRQSRARKKQAG